MRFNSMHEVYLWSLLYPGTSHAIPVDEVLDQLRAVSQKDFGNDIDAWVEWLRNSNDVETKKLKEETGTGPNGT